MHPKLIDVIVLGLSLLALGLLIGRTFQFLFR
jgi:hypothetical protein